MTIDFANIIDPLVLGCTPSFVTSMLLACVVIPKTLEQINTACRNGVTVWHNHSNLGNYSLDNSIA